MELDAQKQHCTSNCITIPKLPLTSFKDLSSRSARELRLTQYPHCLKELQAKMKIKLSNSEEALASKYWISVYQVALSLDKPESDDSECRDSQSELLPVDAAIVEWEKK